jgi:hypothetical protein
LFQVDTKAKRAIAEIARSTAPAAGVEVLIEPVSNLTAGPRRTDQARGLNIG